MTLGILPCEASMHDRDPESRVNPISFEQRSLKEASLGVEEVDGEAKREAQLHGELDPSFRQHGHPDHRAQAAKEGRVAIEVTKPHVCGGAPIEEHTGGESIVKAVSKVDKPLLFGAVAE